MASEGQNVVDGGHHRSAAATAADNSNNSETTIIIDHGNGALEVLNLGADADQSDKGAELVMIKRNDHHTVDADVDTKKGAATDHADGGADGQMGTAQVNDDNAATPDSESAPVGADVNQLPAVEGQVGGKEAHDETTLPTGGDSYNDDLAEFKIGPDTCVFCMNDAKILVLTDLGLKCGHRACHKCLNLHAASSMASRISYPPTCCCGASAEPINLKGLEEHLDPMNRTRLAACTDEFSTANPTWCFHPACSAFLRADESNSQAQFLRCPQCGDDTCTKCKALKTTHAGPEGCVDLLSAADRALMEDQEWKQCPNQGCRKLIERVAGCHSMTCPCGAQFCWRCLSEFDAAKKTAKCGCHDEYYALYQLGLPRMPPPSA